MYYSIPVRTSFSGCYPINCSMSSSSRLKSSAHSSGRGSSSAAVYTTRRSGRMILHQPPTPSQTTMPAPSSRRRRSPLPRRPPTPPTTNYQLPDGPPARSPRSLRHPSRSTACPSITVVVTPVAATVTLGRATATRSMVGGVRGSTARAIDRTGLLPSPEGSGGLTAVGTAVPRLTRTTEGGRERVAVGVEAVVGVDGERINATAECLTYWVDDTLS